VELVVQGVSGLLVPAKAVRAKSFPVLHRRVEIEPAVRVDGKTVSASHKGKNLLDPFQIFRQEGPADLDLHHPVPGIQVAAHFVPQLPRSFPGVVIAARGVDEHPVCGSPVVVAVGEQTVKGFFLDLGHRVPHGHVDDAHRHRAFSVAARFLVGHQDVPEPERIEVVFRLGHVRPWIGFPHAGKEPLPQQAPLRVPAVGVEPVSHDRFAVPDHVGDHGRDRHRHPAEVDERVADGGGDGSGALLDVDDLHRRVISPMRRSPRR
jgi:hypothetical protein